MQSIYKEGYDPTHWIYAPQKIKNNNFVIWADAFVNSPFNDLANKPKPYLVKRRPTCKGGVIEFRANTIEMDNYSILHRRDGLQQIPSTID